MLTSSYSIHLQNGIVFVYSFAYAHYLLYHHEVFVMAFLISILAILFPLLVKVESPLLYLSTFCSSVPYVGYTYIFSSYVIHTYLFYITLCYVLISVSPKLFMDI